VRRVTVVGRDGGVVADLAGQALAEALMQPGSPRAVVVPPLLPPGRRAVTYLWAPLEGSPPAAVAHRVEVGAVGAVPPVEATLTLAAVPVSPRPAVAIDPPLGGGPWVAVYDPLLMGGHRTTLIAVDGVARIPARFAIDWIPAPAPGAPAAPAAGTGAPANGFGADVLAVADARVVTIRDGAADLPPGVLRTPQPLALEEGSGNYVVLDVGGDRFAIYEHLKRDSVRVKVGQRVRRGEVIAALGSSGSTSVGPHLHFHVADAGATLTAEGVPFVLRRFELLGAFASLDALFRGEPWQPASAAAGTRRHEHPPAAAVVAF
jgi:murein DD-endopeptidase